MLGMVLDIPVPQHSVQFHPSGIVTFHPKSSVSAFFAGMMPQCCVQLPAHIVLIRVKPRNVVPSIVDTIESVSAKMKFTVVPVDDLEETIP